MVWLARGLAFMLAGLTSGLACVALGRLSPTASLLGRHLLVLPLAGVLVWIGAACLRRVETPGRAWGVATRRCFWSGMSVFFFSPFVYFADRAPEVDYLVLNFLCFSLASAMLVCCVNRMVFRLAEFHEDRGITLWARGSEWFSYATLLVAAGAFATATWIVAMEEGMEMEGAVELFWGDFWPWLLRLCLAPVCVTAALLWTMKTVTLARLRALASMGEKVREENRAHTN